MTEIVSKHLVRRTARRKADYLDKSDPTANYIVKRYYGRLFKWAVYRKPRLTVEERHA
jgi:hypothetical protein